VVLFSFQGVYPRIYDNWSEYTPTEITGGIGIRRMPAYIPDCSPAYTSKGQFRCGLKASENLAYWERIWLAWTGLLNFCSTDTRLQCRRLRRSAYRRPPSGIRTWASVRYTNRPFGHQRGIRNVTLHVRLSLRPVIISAAHSTAQRHCGDARSSDLSPTHRQHSC